MSADRRRVEDLWIRAASGDVLSPAEETALLHALAADPALREGFLADLDLERTLEGLGRAEPDGAGFVRSFTRRLELEQEGSGFVRRVEQGLSRKHRTRRGSAFTRRNSGTPLVWAAAALIALGLLAAAFGPRRSPDPRIVRAPAPALPEPPAPRPEPPPEELPAPLRGEERPRPALPTPAPPPLAPEPSLDVPAPAVPTKPPPSSPPAAPPKPEETRIAVALIESVDGAASDAPLLPDRPFQAVGVTVIKFPDGTRLELAPAARLGGLSLTPGKRIELADGTIHLDVPRQPAGQPLVVVTAQADVTVLGTRFTVMSSGGQSRVDVREGRVRVRRLADREAVDVAAGQSTLVAADVDLVAAKPVKFVKAVNFNGPAVTIDRQRWMSHDQAVADGLAFSPAVELFSGAVTPRTPAPADTSLMLSTSVYRQKGAFGITWPIPNGTYDVHLWVMENVRDNHRRFDAALEGVPVLRDIGRGAPLGEWGRLGPVRVTVRDGVLNVDLIPRKADAHLMGLSVFEVP